MRSQAINIPRLIESKYDVFDRIDTILRDHGFSKILFTLGKGIDKLFEARVNHLIESSVLQVKGPLVLEELDVEKLTEIAYSIESYDAIVSMGGGKAIDCGKYISFLRDIPFISVPTSISNDGFASSNASLMVKGERKSVKAVMPYGIIADLDILTTAPKAFYYSGLGDVISKITAAYDWQYEVNHGIGQLDHFALLTSKKSVNSVVRLSFDYIHDGLFIKEVVDSLIMSGISMEVAGHSSPASGSEHLISHAMDKMAPGAYLHGIQVGIATYIMALSQDYRVNRVRTFLRDTGFFDYVKELAVPRELLVESIKLGPSIKPQRRTCLHEASYRQRALKALETDEILKEILA